MSMLFLWVVTPCGLVGRYQLSEEHTVPIFRDEGRHNPEQHRHLHCRKKLKSYSVRHNRKLRL
jgi:hypothetical protein